MPAKGAMKSPASLLLSMPQMRTSGRETRSLSSRTPAPARGRRTDCARHRATIRMLGGSDPYSRPAPSRCMRAGQVAVLQALCDMALADARIVEAAQRGDGVAGIVDLMAARQLRHRQIEQPVLVLIDEAAMLLIGLPVLVGDDAAARRIRLRDALDLGARLVRLRRR